MSTIYIKYPRTYHLPFSESKTDDDKTLKDCSIFDGKEVVVTIKMDGENTTMYNNYIHARSLDSKHHESREWVKRIQGEIGYLIPEHYRICGENLYAKHSIEYNDLHSYFYVFSVWDKSLCLNWDETKKICEQLKLDMVTEIYRGKFDQKNIMEKYSLFCKQNKVEGFVVRNSSSFEYNDFSQNVAKYVRKNHVQTDKHWMNQKIIPNGLKK
jgi:hypothetical protein